MYELCGGGAPGRTLRELIAFWKGGLELMKAKWSLLVGVVLVVVGTAGCGGGGKSHTAKGVLAVGKNCPSGISIKDGTWEVTVDEVEQMGAENLPVKALKAITSWLHLNGTLIYNGTAAVDGLQVKVTAWEKSTNRAYPIVLEVGKVFRHNDTYPLDDKTSYLGLGEIEVSRCDLDLFEKNPK